MLKHLSIVNLAVIRRLKVDFHQGLNVLTGETGAGKSIIIDALTLLLGARSSYEMVRTGERAAVVEGVFAPRGLQEARVKESLEQIGIELADDEYLIVRREVQLGGRNRVFINDRNVTATTLRLLQPLLVEVHGQGEQKALLSPRSHLLLLDDYGGCGALRARVSAAYGKWRNVLDSLASPGRDEAERERELDLLRYQLAEIGRIAPLEGEEERLRSERRLLMQSERALELTASAYGGLYERDQSVLAGLASVGRNLRALESIDERAAALREAVEGAMQSLQEVADELRGYGAGDDFSPARLAQVEERLAEFERLRRKYGREVHELGEVRAGLEKRLEELSNWAERERELRGELEAAEQEYTAYARELTACRLAVAPRLEEQVMDDLRHVAMENARFHVRVRTAEERGSGAREVDSPEAEDGAEKDLPNGAPPYWSRVGADRAEFLLSANVGEEARPLSRVASGGELSRLMLTLRTVCRAQARAGDGEGAGATLIFDEVDTGIGGSVAEAVGRRLKSLAATQQVLCVTHQPQIARFAAHHYSVAKRVEGERTVTTLKELGWDERVDEVARMIGAGRRVESARETAEWLLRAAAEAAPPAPTRRKRSGVKVKA